MAIYLGENRVVDARPSGGTAPTLISKNITSNGTYTAASDGADGYSSVDVNVASGSDELVKSIIDRSITSINNSEVTVIGEYVFRNCLPLMTANFPNCVSIGSYAFYNCGTLTLISFPKCTSIYINAFYNCPKLKVASFPECTTIGGYAFRNCFELTTVNFPKCTSVGTYAFGSCRDLTTAEFGDCSTIANYAFTSCYNLVSLYLTGDSVPTLGGLSTFSSTPIGGYSTSAGQYGSIYVPASLYDEYISGVNWNVFSSRIVSI